MEKSMKNTSDRVPLVLTYHPHNFAIQNILIRNFKFIVLGDKYMSSVFNDLLPIEKERV